MPSSARCPGEELVENEAERVDVAPRRDLLPGELLRRHVGRCSGANRFARRAGEPEVGDADLAAAVEHDVGGLEIAVDDVALVRRGEARADLPRDLERAIFGKSSDALQQRGQILAVDVLHRQERGAVDLVDVVDAADVRVRDLPRHPHFGVQLRQSRWIAIDIRRQELQRDRLSELQVVCAVDLAHAAAAEAFDDAVSAAEKSARLRSGHGRWRQMKTASRSTTIGSRPWNWSVGQAGDRCPAVAPAPGG